MSNKVLVVAINDYPGTANDLPSCLEDAKKFTELLKSPPYDFGEIRSHFDADATLENVLNGLDWLCENAEPEDRRVFYFSGHGYRTPKDGILRECLCLYDKFFFDNEFSEKTQDLPLGILTVVLDSCHSGGMEKAFFVVQPGEDPIKVKTWLPHPEEMVKSWDAEQQAIPFKPFGCEPIDPVSPLGAMGKSMDATADKAVTPQVKGLLITACQADETAAASTSKTNGMSAFTYCLIKAFTNLGKSLTSYDLLSSNDLFQAVAQELKALSFKQNPAIKEPREPQGLGARSFITLRPITAKFSAPETVSGSVNLPLKMTDIIRNAIEAMRNQNKEFQPTVTTGDQTMPVAQEIQLMSTKDKAWWNDVINVAVQLAPVIAGAISKDFDPSAPATTGMSVKDKAWWNDVINVAVQLAPVIAGAVSKDFDPSAPATTGMPVKDKAWWNDVINAAIQIAPVIAGAVSKDFDPSATGTPTSGNGTSAPVADEKFWGAVLQVAAQVVPVIIQAVSKDFDPSGTGTPTSGNGTSAPVADEKFWGAVLQVAAQVVPVIIQAVTKDFKPTSATSALPSMGGAAGMPATGKFEPGLGSVNVEQLARQLAPILASQVKM